LEELVPFIQSLRRRTYACTSEKAYHSRERSFNLRSLFSPAARAASISSAPASSGGIRAVRTVLELVMREELDAFIGAAWGACSPKRKGYRNGTYTRDLVTSTGRIEDIHVPRDREGQFHTQVFDRYSRFEPHIARSVSPRCS